MLSSRSVQYSFSRRRLKPQSTDQREPAQGPVMHMRTILTLLIIGLAAGAEAGAATIVNKDAQPYLLKITESGHQSEVGIAPGQSVDACASGCFLTMPNGDRETLSGSESVEIVGGKASIK